MRKQRGRLESSQRQDAAKGRLDDPDLDAAAFDAAEPATRIAPGEARLFRHGRYPTAHAPEPDELAQRVTEVRNLAASMLLDPALASWRQLQGWISTLPLGVDALGMRRVFDTDALASSFPFTSPDLPIASGGGMGVLFGFNLASPGVIVWEPLTAANTATQTT